MNTVAEQVASHLLQIKAIKLGQAAASAQAAH